MTRLHRAGWLATALGLAPAFATASPVDDALRPRTPGEVNIDPTGTRAAFIVERQDVMRNRVEEALTDPAEHVAQFDVGRGPDGHIRVVYAIQPSASVSDARLRSDPGDSMSAGARSIRTDTVIIVGSWALIVAATSHPSPARKPADGSGPEGRAKIGQRALEQVDKRDAQGNGEDPSCERRTNGHWHVRSW
jgi:hypothetical protein